MSELRKCAYCNSQFIAFNKYAKFCSTDCYYTFRREFGREALSNINNGTISELEWNECIEYFNNSCAYCGSKDGTLHKDHFIPSSKGGTFAKENIIPACGKCNSGKNNRELFIWYVKKPFFSKERLRKILEYLNYI